MRNVYLVLVMLNFINLISYSQAWQTKGTAGFTNPSVSDIQLAADSRDTVYILYKASTSGYSRFSVRRWNGLDWELVGSQGFSGNYCYDAAIDFDENDVPYVSYSDGSNAGGISVKKFDGSNWVYVGSPGFTPADGGKTSIDVVSSTEIYVSYQDGNLNDRCSAMKYDGVSWTQLGMAGFTAYSVTETDLVWNQGEVYVAYRGIVPWIHVGVQKFDGTTWSFVGSSEILKAKVLQVQLMFTDQNVPVIGFKDSRHDLKPVVCYFDGVDWEFYGETGFSEGVAYSTSMALDEFGTPYFAYGDAANSSKASLMKYDGVKWVYVGEPGFTSGAANYESVLVRKSGEILVAFREVALNKATVMSYVECPINRTVYQDGYTFTSQAQNATFQWLDCSNGCAPIAGEISGSFTSHITGEYAVEISSMGCVDTSSKYLVDDSWVKAFGGSIQDKVMDVVTDDEGNVFITGKIKGDCDMNFDASTFMSGSDVPTHIYLQKYNPSGRLLWTRLLDSNSPSIEEGRTLVVDHNNDIIVAGAFFSTIDFDPGTALVPMTANGSDIFIVKYSNDGKFLWSGSIGGSSTSDVKDVVVDSENNVFLIGNFYSTVDFDPGPGVYSLSSNGVNDVYVLKLNAFGDFVWAKTFGGTSHDMGYCLAVDRSDNLMIGGNFLSSNVDFDPNAGTDIKSSWGNYDIFLSKYDNDGNYLWTKFFQNSTDFKAPKSLVCDSLNHIYMVGNFDGQVDFDPGIGVHNISSVNNGTDAFVLKLDSLGAFDWVSIIGNSQVENAYDVKIDMDGNIAVAGKFHKSSDLDPGAAVVTAGFYPASVCVLDPILGGLVDFKPIGVIASSIAIDPYNNYYISGTYSEVTGFNLMDEVVPYDDNGSGDAYLVKIPGSCNINTQTYLYACDSLQHYDGNTYYNTVSVTGYVSEMGSCDALNVANIFISESTSSSISASACFSYQSPSGHYSWTATGTYLDTITNAVGCDSVITVSLIMDTMVSSSHVVNICQGDSVLIDGVYESIAGNYVEYYTSINGCDSLKYIDLQVRNLQVNLVSFSDTLIVIPGGYNYQWYDCVADSIIIMNTDTVFVPSYTSSYKVIASDQGCSDTSLCVFVDLSSVSESNIGQVNLYPNPVEKNLTVALDHWVGYLEYTVFDLYGKKVIERGRVLSSDLFVIDVNTLTRGSYFLEINAEGVIQYFRFVKL